MDSKYKVPPFIKRDEDSLIFNGDGELIFYIPEVYFERNLAVEEGDKINLIGIFNYTIQNKGKDIGLKTFNYPSLFTTKPYTIEKLKNVKLLKSSKESDYRMLKYKKGDIVVLSVFTEQEITNADVLLSMAMTGKLPTTIDYRIIKDLFLDNIKINGESYSINNQLFGIFQAESCRSNKNIKELFRHTDMSDMTDYQYIATKMIPKYISAYTSFTSENIDEGIVHSIIAKGHKQTPLEKIII